MRYADTHNKPEGSPLTARTLSQWAGHQPADSPKTTFQGGVTVECLAAHNILPVTEMTVPDGYRLDRPMVVLRSGIPTQEGTLVNLADEESERIAGLAAEHGTMVGQLVAALGAFDITLPTSLPECMPTMYAACKADPTLNADSQLAQVLYSQLLTYMTDDDIYQVATILTN